MDKRRKTEQKKVEKSINDQKKNKQELKKMKIKEEKKNKGVFSELFNIFGAKKEAPQTTQDTLKIDSVTKDGIIKVKNSFSKTIEFEDINYQLANNEDKELIFSKYCEFLNYFDNSIKFQLSFVNKKGNLRDFLKKISIKEQEDDFNEIRREYTQMLKNNLSKGNNGLIKKKYITFTIESDSVKVARPRLERIELDILNNFKVLGVNANPLNGLERLKVIHGILNGKEIFPLKKWDFTDPGVNIKNLIAPSSFQFSERTFKIGERYCSSSFLQILAPELDDRMLANLVEIESDLIINFHIQSLEQNKAIKSVKQKITDLDSMKIEEQKKAIRAGYDSDILPSDLKTYSEEAKGLLDDLQSRNERMFSVTIIITNEGSTREKLEDYIFQVSGIVQKYNCALKRLDYQQEQSLRSLLPIGVNEIDIERGLTTSSTAIFIPFTTQELFQQDPGSSFYGINALSNNLIMVDRKKLKTPNGLILGTPGSGKSFSAKREMTDVFLGTEDDLIVCDPEREFTNLVELLNGQIVRLGSNSKDTINLMDFNLNYSDDDNPLTLKAEFILSFFELILGRLSPLEKTVIDRSVRLVYRNYMEDPREENIPILEDLYNILRQQEEVEAKDLSVALEIYVKGSLNVFNNKTNVNLDNRVVCFDIRDLGPQVKKIGMLLVQDQVWNRVTINRALKKATRYYIDEFHLLLKEEQTANYSIEIWKRFRKWGGIPTGITQNVKDLLSSPEISNIFDNSDFVYMLNQAPGDREIIGDFLKISPHQMSYVTNSDEGHGLIMYGNTIIPFVDRFPKDTILYKMMTTKPDETPDEKEA